MIINPEAFPLQALYLKASLTNIIMRLPQIPLAQQQVYLVLAIRAYLRRKKIMSKFMKTKPIRVMHSVKR